MYKILVVALACLLLTASQSWSSTPQTLEPIVVTATKLETPAREVASSVTVITAEEIENKQQTTVAEVLRDVPGVDVVRSGIGMQTSVFTRGTNSEHTLVLIDGIEVNDPISTARAFDFAHLATNNIERIEIVRGAGSTLYGSDAIGGVINIITKRGTGKPQLSVSVEGGSYETHQESIGISGGNELVHYSLSASYLDTDGITAASKKNGNSERDGYQRKTVSGRIGLTPAANFDLDFILRYTNSDTDIDDAFGLPQDDPNNSLEQETLFLRTEARLALLEDRWEQKLSFSLTDYDRDSIDKANLNDPFDFDFKMFFKSRLKKVDWQNNLILHETNTLTLGIEHEKEKAKTTYFDEETATTKGYYLQDQIKLWDTFFTTLGVRFDDHDKFGTHTTYRIASAYLFKQTNTKVRASYGTGFKAPSLYQLYAGSGMGNPDLDPERSNGWDIGIDQGLFGGKASVSVTYFQNDLKDLITWDSNNFTYIQTDEAKTKGVEASASISPLEHLTIGFNYTYTDAEDEETGKELVRRPRNKFGVDLAYRLLDRGNLGLSVTHVGDRKDTVSGNRVKLADYTLVNLTASYELTDKIRLHGRIDNLFDKDYEELFGYEAPGIAGYVGAQLTF